MRRILSVALTLALAPACAKVIGNSTAGITNDFVMPEVLGGSDVGTACASGEALGSMVAGFSPYSKKAARSSILPQVSAGMCKEEEVWAAELRAERAYRDGDVQGYKDASIERQRHQLIAAKRYHIAFQRVEAYYGIPTPEDATCPKLKSENDQLQYMMGLSAGLLAVLHDIGADTLAGVPQDIPARVARGVDCLDDDQWWGVPMAMRASLWALLPDAEGAGDPWEAFDQSWEKATAARVRLAGAFMVQSASVVGNEARLTAGIQAFAKERKTVAPDPKWAMLDRYAELMVRHESDRIWMDAEGHRTPMGQLGDLPQPQEPDIILDDDIFGELGDEEPPPAE